MQTTDKPPHSPPMKRRGRPPRWSREQIVDAVAAMLLADPNEPLTIARAADAVGAKPMSLYRHFRDRDDLVAAVARHVFFDTCAPPDANTPWQEQVRTWMLSVHAQARRAPQLVHMMASGESAEWLVGTAGLAAIFEGCDITDDRVVAEAIYWVATVTMGHAMIEAAGPHHLEGDRIQAAVDRLDAVDAARVVRLIPQFTDMRRDGFDRIVELVIRQLVDMLADRDQSTAVGI